MLKPMKEIQQLPAEGLTSEAFADRIRQSNQPLVMRSLVSHWPLVQMAKMSADSAIKHLVGFDNHTPVYTIIGDPSIKGRFFYGNELQGVNFKKINAAVTATVEQMMRLSDNPNPHAVSIQAASVRNTLPGFLNEHSMPILADEVEPTIWISNQSRVAPHFDLNHNIACVVTGRRSFTLFPPAQTSNLYIGPVLSTPSGVPISLVDIDKPDFNLFPDFAKALEQAQTATLEPGDAIYIPSPWWHSVKSLEPINTLVNYWWNEHLELSQPSAKDSLLTAMLAITKMDTDQRLAWQDFFNYFVFKSSGEQSKHLPSQLNDLSTGVSDELAIEIQTYLAEQIAPPKTDGS